MKLNQRIVDALELPEGKRSKIYWDSECTGLGARIQGNARKWIVRFRVKGNPKQRQVNLGPLAGISLKKARELAAEYTTSAKRGTDRAAVETAEAQEAHRIQQLSAERRLDALVEQYLSHAELELRPSTLRELRRYLRVHWKPLHGEVADELEKRDLVLRLEAIAVNSGPVAANRARSYLSMALAWGIKRGILDSNPLIGIAPIRAEVTRERVLTSDEVVKLWTETKREGDFAKIVRLLILTAQRREEVASMRWSELDLDRRLWEIPSARTKNRRPHQVPLSEQVVIILGTIEKRDGRDLIFGTGRGGFSGWGQSKDRSDCRSGLTNWRIHDLRRTAVTGMAELGIQPHVIEAVVNHISGHKGGVAGIYNRATYADEKRIALQRWADHVSRLVGEKADSTVVSMSLAK